MAEQTSPHLWLYLPRDCAGQREFWREMYGFIKGDVSLPISSAWLRVSPLRRSVLGLLIDSAQLECWVCTQARDSILQARIFSLLGHYCCTNRDSLPEFLTQLMLSTFSPLGPALPALTFVKIVCQHIRESTCRLLIGI